jgi:hypothetical protein
MNSQSCYRPRGWQLGFITTVFYHSLVAVMWFLIQLELDNWVNWNIPYQSLFFSLHLVEMIMDAVKFQQIDLRTNRTQWTLTQVHLYQTVTSLTVISDLATLIRCMVHVDPIDTTGTHVAVAQLSLVAVVMAITLWRFGLSFTIEEVEAMVTRPSIRLVTAGDATCNPRLKNRKSGAGPVYSTAPGGYKLVSTTGR